MKAISDLQSPCLNALRKNPGRKFRVSELTELLFPDQEVTHELKNRVGRALMMLWTGNLVDRERDDERRRIYWARETLGSK